MLASAFPRIILLGPRGSGKSSVGALLSQRLDADFLDLDREIQRRARRPIAEIFAEVGDPGFRELEADALRDALLSTADIIATGGGVILREPNRELLRRTRAMRVFLHADPAILWHRVRADPHSIDARPDLTRLGGEAEMRHVLDHRMPFYYQVATHDLDTSARSPQDVTEEILKLWSAAPVVHS